MNIYIFLPYKWSFCGGMAVVIAEDIKLAITLLWVYFQEEDKDYDGVITADPEDSRIKEDHWDQWLLEDSYPITATERKVIVNSNDA